MINYNYHNNNNNDNNTHTLGIQYLGPRTPRMVDILQSRWKSSALAGSLRCEGKSSSCQGVGRTPCWCSRAPPHSQLSATSRGHIGRIA